MLANRLRRQYRHLRKRMARAGVTCFRLYERDISDQPLIIDWYDGEVVVWVFPRTKDETDEDAFLWRAGIVPAVREGLAVPIEKIHVKRRERKKGKNQYERLAQEGHIRTVDEQGLRFEVNLSDYLDTGLFLDHRLTRARVRDEAANKDVLNLFAYTGSFSCYAAAGGAKTTLTVDMNAGYCEWARRNLSLNGFDDDDRHRVVQADCVDWLWKRRPPSFDLIVCDPPTFSNSKKMSQPFSVAKDHGWMLEHCFDRLRDDGVMYFSTNDRSFHLEDEVLSAWTSHAEITPASIPEDFRNRKIHRCWRLVK